MAEFVAPPKQVNFQHQWMFSILPVHSVGGDQLIAVGLCRNCHNTLTNSLPWSPDTTQTLQHSIPEFPDWGCIDTRE